MAELTELVYNLAKSGVFTPQNDNVPHWAAFHSKPVSVVNLKVTNVAINLIIMAPLTDYSTICTTLLRQKEETNALVFRDATVFVDMGLLPTALEITWAKSAELSNVFPCEGGMHLRMSFFAGIGYLYGEAGLKHLLSESGVYAKGTVQHMLTGKDLDRAICGVELVEEVLTNIFLIQFNTLCVKN